MVRSLLLVVTGTSSDFLGDNSVIDVKRSSHAATVQNRAPSVADFAHKERAGGPSARLARLRNVPRVDQCAFDYPIGRLVIVELV
jgi:hypothetical protein